MFILVCLFRAHLIYSHCIASLARWRQEQISILNNVSIFFFLFSGMAQQFVCHWRGFCLIHQAIERVAVIVYKQKQWGSQVFSATI